MTVEVLIEDINALNRAFLDICARHSAYPDELCLRLNVSRHFLETVESMPSQHLANASRLGQALVQPAIDASELRDAATLPVDQGRALLRSATRVKHAAPGR